MAYRFNSSIKIKKKTCKSCGNPNSIIFSRGRCQACATREDIMARIAADEEEESTTGLPDLISELDMWFSKFIRLSAADKDGFVNCFICNKRERWQESQNMHYISRKSAYLRFSEDNCKAGCKGCNEIKGGNLLKYGKKLEKQKEGSTELLLEYSRIPYKYTRAELITLIGDYKQKVNQLLKRFQ